jgi:hypothetical protein
VDRQAIARRRRAKQARELLEDERERERALQEELEERVAESDGPALDDAVFARMEADEAALLRNRLAWIPDDGPPPEESFWGEDEPSESERDEVEEEIARLERELALCRRLQEASRRYLELLGE